MYIKTIVHKDDRGKTDYKIYSKEEADEEGIDYKPWYKTKKGEYGCTDDDVVMKCISVKEYNSAGRTTTLYFTFPLASVFKNSKYNTKKFRAKDLRGGTYRIGNTIGVTKEDKSNFERMAMEYALIPNIHRTIDRVLGPHSKHTHNKWFRKLKTENFKNMVREEVERLLDDSGFTKEDTMALLKTVIKLAKEKNDITNLRHVVEDLMDLHGMNEKDKSKTVDSIKFKQQDLIDKVNRSAEIKREKLEDGRAKETKSSSETKG